MRFLLASVPPQLAALKSRWLSLPLRDRRALAALAIFFVLAGGWLGVVSPAMNFAGDSRAALEQAQADLIWMQANALAARQAGARATQAGVGQSLLTAVNASARSSGLNLQRFEPDGEQRVRVTLENAVFTDVMRWVVILQEQYGLAIDSFSADAQAQPGIVNIRLTVGRPS